MKIRQHGRAFDIEGHGPRDHITRVMAETGAFYESDLLDYIRFIAAGPTAGQIAVDVGANIGNHSIYLANFVSSVVLAIEPNPQVLPTLRRNLGQNPGEFEIHDVAVGDREGTGNMQCILGDKNIGMAQVEMSGTHGSGPIRVETLDGILSRRVDSGLAQRRVDVVKIDVEGMELEVLRGAEVTLRTHRPHLFVEAIDDVALEALTGYLAPLEYAKLSQWARTPVFHFAFRPSGMLRLRVACYVAFAHARRLLHSWVPGRRKLSP